MQFPFRMKDFVNWVEVIEVNVNMIFMLDMGYPEPGYWVRFGKVNTETNAEIIFNREPEVLRCDYDFLSKVLAEFIQKKQVIKSMSYFDDVNFSLLCVPDKYEPFVVFNVGAYNFFEEDSWDRSNGGIGIVFHCEWAELEAFTWKLQTAELMSMVRKLDSFRQATPHPELDNLYNKYNKQLQTNLKVIDNWEHQPIPQFQPIESWRSGTYRSLLKIMRESNTSKPQ